MNLEQPEVLNTLQFLETYGSEHLNCDEMFYDKNSEDRYLFRSDFTGLDVLDNIYGGDWYRISSMSLREILDRLSKYSPVVINDNKESKDNLFKVKNAVDWETFKSRIDDDNYQLAFDQNNLDRLMSFSSCPEGYLVALDDLFGGNWEYYTSHNYNQLAEHHEVKTEPLKVMTQREARDYYLCNIDRFTREKLFDIIWVDTKSNDRFIVNSNQSAGLWLDLKFHGNWIPLKDYYEPNLILGLAVDNNPNNLRWVNSSGYKPEDYRKSIDFAKLQYKPEEVMSKLVPDIITSRNSDRNHLECEPHRFETDLTSFLVQFKMLLISKNQKYGNSALNPKNVFSKSSSSEIILQQLDHKLSRIENSDNPIKNDYIDLMGYLTLFCISQDWFDLSDLKD